MLSKVRKLSMLLGFSSLRCVTCRLLPRPSAFPAPPPVPPCHLPCATPSGNPAQMVKHPQQLGGLTRAGLVLLRLAAASEVFRVGYLVGSYRQVGGWGAVARSVARWTAEPCSAPAAHIAYIRLSHGQRVPLELLYNAEPHGLLTQL